MAVQNPTDISGQILQDVVGRLSDPNIGFNAQLPLTIASNPRYQTNAVFLLNAPLVFPANYVGFSNNVLLAPLAIDSWIRTSPASDSKNLLMQIYIINAVPTPPPGNTKGLLFDGKVNVGIDCHIGWPNSKAIYDMDAPVSAVESCIFTIFNTMFPTDQYQAWSAGTIYNGVIGVPERSQVIEGGPGFRQATVFRLSFGLQKR